MSLNLRKIGITIISVALIALFLCPTKVFANTISEYKFEQDRQKIMQYIMIDDNGIFYFDERAAHNNNEEQFIIEAGLKLEEISLEYYQSEKSLLGKGLTLPLYGNFCGPGYGDMTQDPIDFLDAKCKEHDECYGTDYYYSCDCDQTLVDAIQEKYDSMYGEMKSASLAVATYFQYALDNASTEPGGVGHCQLR